MIYKDLRFVLESAEGTAVNDPVAVALEVEPEAVLVFRVHAPTSRGTILRIGREVTGLTSLQIKTASRHPNNLSSYEPRFN